jgi:hypothetical protein
MVLLDTLELEGHRATGPALPRYPAFPLDPAQVPCERVTQPHNISGSFLAMESAGGSTLDPPARLRNTRGDGRAPL